MVQKKVRLPSALAFWIDQSNVLFATLLARLCSLRLAGPPSTSLRHLTVLEEAHRVIPRRVRRWSEDTVGSAEEAVAGDRMTDEAWQQQLQKGNYPPLPIWTQDFLLSPGVKNSIPLENLDQGETGC